MNKVIWKFSVEPSIVHFMPKGAEFLSLQTQSGEPQMWFLCDPDQPTERRAFHCIPTGWVFDTENGNYLGTFQASGGARVFHVFETAQPQTGEGKEGRG